MKFELKLFLVLVVQFCYKKRHDIDILLGEEITDNTTTINTNLYKNIPRNLGAETSINTKDNYGAQAAGYPNYGKERETIASFFTRINYSLDKKYLIGFVMRADGSSKFSPDNRWGYFPSASLGWRVSSEKFFEKIKFIDDLKFRASYGANGGDKISNYQFLTSFRSDVYYYGINNQVIKAYTPTVLANEKLKWEALVSQNIGLDITLFKRRLEINVDYYVNHPKDLLLYVPVANTFGYSTQQQNIGKTTNRGVEIQ